MRITIIGLGSIGKTLLASLAGKNHIITIIDEKKDMMNMLVEKYDVMGVVGNGACMDLQREANVMESDIVIALTRSDELNIFACLVAKKLGAKNTAARVRNPDYRKQISEMKDDLGISMIVNPEKETANEIFNMIDIPYISNIEYFANGKALLVQVVVEPGCLLAGETLATLGQSLKSRVLICAVQRGDSLTIPSGNFVLHEGDKIHFTAAANTLSDFITEVKLRKSPFKNILIVGGGQIGFYLADELSKKKYAIKIVEKDKNEAERLAELLPRATVVCGNGTQHDLLVEEGLHYMDAFVALTNIDEENMIVSMFAKKMHVKKSIAKIKNEELFATLEELQISNNVSPNDIVTDRLISYIRSLANNKGSNVLTLYRLVNNRVEALEFAVRKKSSIVDVPLKDLQLKENCLIACITRKSEVIIPDGNSCIRTGDNVIIVTTHKDFNDLTDIFKQVVR